MKEEKIFNLAKTLHKTILEKSYKFFYNTRPSIEFKIEIMIYSLYHLFNFIHVSIPQHERTIVIAFKSLLGSYLNDNMIKLKISDYWDFVILRHKIYFKEFENLKYQRIPLNILRNIYFEPFIVEPVNPNAIENYIDMMQKMIDFKAGNNPLIETLKNSVKVLSSEIDLPY